MFLAGFQSKVYQYIAKPILFRQDPEDVHDRVIQLGQSFGVSALLRWLTKFLFLFRDSILEQDILGIHFKNPIGLAAGFDKNAQLTKILPSVGFGFEEIGSITGEYCEGNPKPRLWRHPELKSLLVYYGLKNDGCEAIARRLFGQVFDFPVGVSVAKTNSPNTVDTQSGIADYLKAYKAFEHIGAYDTINISCPNVYGGQPFFKPTQLQLLLEELSRHRNQKPMFLKLSPDPSLEQLHDVAVIAKAYNVDGLICGNLTKKHTFGKGGLSGKSVETLSVSHLSYLHEHFPEFTLIACGGVFTAEDAYQRIRQGASLVQLATGMIYQGPQVIGQINYGLACMLKRDGFNNIAEAIGADSSK